MQLAVNVLVLTAVYAMLAAGFVLIYRASKVFNLAHGDAMMFGGYIFFTCLVATKGSLLAAVLLALAAGFLIGVLIYRVGIRPLAGYPVAPIVFSSPWRSASSIRAAATLIWGGRSRFPASLLPFRDTPLHLPGGDAMVSTFDLAMIGAALGLLRRAAAPDPAHRARRAHARRRGEPAPAANSGSTSMPSSRCPGASPASAPPSRRCSIRPRQPRARTAGWSGCAPSRRR